MKTYQKLACILLAYTFLVAALISSMFFMDILSSFAKSICCIALLIALAAILSACWNYIKTKRKRYEENLAGRITQMREAPSNDELADAVLYLRPFKADGKEITEVEYGGVYYRNVEALICQMFDEAVVAIGKPGETLPPRGAYRFYETGDTWKEKVTELMEKAKYVVLYVDFTPGVKWEIEAALNNYRDKVILVPAMYNLREEASYAAAITSFLGLSYFLHSLRFNHFYPLMKKLRRSREYYQQWKASFDFGFEMNDTVSAVIFQNGQPIPFRTEKPNLKGQFRAINRAVVAKLGVPAEKRIFLTEGERPSLSLYADVDMDAFVGHVPFAMGRVEFYDKGFRYRMPILRFLSQFNIIGKHHYRNHRDYEKDELRPYSSITNVQYGDHGLKIISRITNGSSQLLIPAYHASCCSDLKKTLEKSISGSLCTEHLEQLRQQQVTQESDYTKATLLCEAISWATGLILTLLSSLPFANELLGVFGIGWNMCIAMMWVWFYNRTKAALPIIAKSKLGKDLDFLKALPPLLAVIHTFLALLPLF